MAIFLLLMVLQRSMAPAELREAGSPLRQGAAPCGAFLLFVPLAFTIVKRGALTSRPPAWFAAHVLASACGAVLVTFHACGGRLLSASGVLLMLLLFLVLQGILARVSLSARFAQQFGSRAASFLNRNDQVDRASLSTLIQRKHALLVRRIRRWTKRFFPRTCATHCVIHG